MIRSSRTALAVGSLLALCRRPAGPSPVSVDVRRRAPYRVVSASGMGTEGRMLSGIAASAENCAVHRSKMRHVIGVNSEASTGTDSTSCWSVRCSGAGIGVWRLISNSGKATSLAIAHGSRGSNVRNARQL